VQLQRSSESEQRRDARRASLTRTHSGGGGILGREAELARMAELLQEERAGAVMVIAGGVSSGKSAFLRAAAAAAAARGRPVLPLAPAAAGAALAFDMDWFAAAIEAHVESLPATLRPLAPLLAELVPSARLAPAALATPASAAALAALEGGGSAATEAALCALAVEVLRPVIGASGGAVLLSDDASSLDALSASLLAEVHAALRPALLLTLPRAELEDPQSGGARLVASLAHRAATTCRTCTLGPLRPRAVGALCAAELEVPIDALPAGLVPALMRLAGGHPLLLKEQLALLLRQGHLRVDADRVHAMCDLATLPELIARSLTNEARVRHVRSFASSQCSTCVCTDMRHTRSPRTAFAERRGAHGDLRAAPPGQPGAGCACRGAHRRRARRLLGPAAHRALRRRARLLRERRRGGGGAGARGHVGARGARGRRQRRCVD
jgi:hypothetical protein